MVERTKEMASYAWDSLTAHAQERPEDIEPETTTAEVTVAFEGTSTRMVCKPACRVDEWKPERYAKNIE
jgi:hypothetical protein